MPVFDQGYQHWTGEVSGHAWRWLPIARGGVRVGLQGRALRILLLVSWLPAVALAAALCLWGLLEQSSELLTSVSPLLGFLDPAILAAPRAHRVEIWTLSFNYFLLTELRFSMVLILLVGPNLISQDLRYNALPLYFSRPLRRVDYYLGKLGVIVAFLGMVIILPSLAAYILGLLFSLDITIVRETFGVLLAAIAYGLVIAVSAGMLILALSSLSRNSRYIALLWLVVWIGSSAVSGVLQSIAIHQRSHQAWRAGHSNGSEALFTELDQAARKDWRPLVSYTANLARIGQHLRGTDASWDKIGALQPPQMRSRFLLTFKGPQYPWYWSALVLTGLLGLSLMILNCSIRSLDRLK